MYVYSDTNIVCNVTDEITPATSYMYRILHRLNHICAEIERET